MQKIKINCLLHFIFISFLIFEGDDSYGQRFTSSPYSRYGIGELNTTGLAPAVGMGNSTIAYLNDTISPYFINISNPASYSQLRLTTIDAGVLSNTIKIESADTSKIVNNTSIAYLAFGFPITKKWGMSAGLMPYSSVGYIITDTKNIDNIGNVDYSYKGTGGINRAYLGNSFSLFSNLLPRKDRLSFGFNASYLFGSINNERTNSFGSTGYYDTRITRSINISDITFDAGMLFTHTVDSIKETRKDSSGKISIQKKDIEDLKFTLGLTFTPTDNISATSNIVGLAEVSNFIDTIENTIDKKGNIKLPLMLGTGFSIKKGERWILNLDYGMQQWSKFMLFDEHGGLNNSMRFGLGGQYIPNKRAEGKGVFFKKIQYRAGVRYADSYIEINGSKLREYSVSLGFGIPLRIIKIGPQFTHSMMNIGIELGTRGTTDNNLIKEQFGKVVVGITLNDRWFIKRKFD